MSDIGDRIKKLRLSLDMKQVQFAQQIRVSQGYLAELEKGKKAPSDRVTLAVSTVFAVDEDWLRTGRGNKKKAEDMLLSKEERELIIAFRRLKAPGKSALFKQIKGR